MTEALRERILAGAGPSDLDPLIFALGDHPASIRLRDALVLAGGLELDLIGCEPPRVAQALMLWLAAQLARRRGEGFAIERITAQRDPDAAGSIDKLDLTEQLLGVLTAPGDETRFLFVDATD